jgi:AAA15 family ATPase/GTPase
LLKNFKAIKRKQKIPVRPLTLIFGPNSSGKSSMIHSLLLMNEVMGSGKFDISKTEIGGDSVDIGGFQQYVFGRDISKNVLFGIEIEVDKYNERLKKIFHSIQSITCEISFGYLQNHNLSSEEPVSLEYIIKADEEEIFSLKRNPSGTLEFSKLNVHSFTIKSIIAAIIENYTITTGTTNEDISSIANSIDQFMKEMLIEEGTLFPVGLKLSQLKEINNVFPIGKENRFEDLLAVIKLVLPWNLHEIINGLNRFLYKEISKIQYLGPLRSYPPRHFTLLKKDQLNWDASGGNAWHILMRETDVRNAVNNWLSSKERLQTPYELKVRTLYDGEKLSQYLLKKLDHLSFNQDPSDILDSLRNDIHNLANSADQRLIEGMGELILLDKRTETPVSHRDVGIGISQTLPVLVSSYASKNKIIGIEQPELHLHPGLQAELADVFINSALGENKNTFILETHSEHLILRIMRRIRETYNQNLPDYVLPIKPEDVSILYVEPIGAEGSAIRFLELDEEGELLDPWPGGFFEEGFHERFS